MSEEISKTKIVLEGRASYLSIFEPRVVEGSNGDPRYSLALIMDKDTREGRMNIKKVNAAILAAKTAGAEGKCPKWGGKVPKSLKISFKDGDERENEEKNPEYDHAMILNCGSKDRPGIVDEDFEDILDKSKVYSGCYIKVEVNFFPFEKGSNGIGCGLNHVMFVKDGEPFAGRGDAATAFGGEAPKKKKIVDEDFDDIM